MSDEIKVVPGNNFSHCTEIYTVKIQHFCVRSKLSFCYETTKKKKGSEWPTPKDTCPMT